jgi:hypothetical protein
MHVITNVTIDIDDDARRATCRSYFTVQQSVDDFSLQPIIAGKYRDAFEKADDGWRFTERIIHPDLLGDLSRHMRGNWIPR